VRARRAQAEAPTTELVPPTHVVYSASENTADIAAELGATLDQTGLRLPTSVPAAIERELGMATGQLANYEGKVLIRYDSSRRSTFGYFTRGRGDGFTMTQAGLEREGLMTGAHEFGHWLDYTLMPRSGPGALFGDSAASKIAGGNPLLRGTRWRGKVDPELHGVFDAVLATPEYQQLINLQSGGYLIRQQEVWARVFAQWVAVHSGNRSLLYQLDHVRRTRGIQWSDASFHRIDREVTVMFKRLGWLA
jgi:hypothetical protein